MAKTARSYQDNRGATYTTPEEAVAADIAAILGRVRGENGLAEGIAKVLLSRRVEVAACFAEYEAMIEHEPLVAKLQRSK